MTNLLRAFTTLVLFLCLSGSAVQAADEAGPRWNILFCFADDWGRYASCYADPDRPSPNDVVRTPHIDRIAREGVRFRNAFVNAPSCTPCRSSLLSGQYFFRTGRGAILQGAVWDSQIPSFPLLLKDAGYHIGETWKVWSPGTPGDAPFGAGRHGYEKAGGGYNNFSENVTKMIRDGMSRDEAAAKLYAEVTGNFDLFLADRKDGQPFCYWFGPTLVHRRWEKGSGKALWNIDPDSLKGRLPKFLPDVHEVREDFADYLGEIQAFDAGVGLLLKKLEAIEELDRTLIVISGDHGAPGFPGGKCNLYDFGTGVALLARVPGVSGGRVVEDFTTLMDLAPTFLEAGRVQPPEVMTGRSLLPVLQSGKSGQVDPSRTMAVTGRERHVEMAREGNLPYPQRAIRTRDFLYIRNFMPDRWPMGGPLAVTRDSAPEAGVLEAQTFAAFADMDASPTKAWLIAQRNNPDWKWHYDYAFAKRPAEELYDLRNDPDQVKNVVGDAAYEAKRKELAKQLLQTLKAAADPRVTGDGTTFDKPPYVEETPGPLPFRKNAGKRKTAEKPGRQQP